LAGTPFTSYQKRLFVFLSVATFFEGYDFIALSQILKELRIDFALSKWDAGLLVAFINLGTVVAYLLVRQADRWGRRRVLAITIAGYTLFTFCTALSPNVYAFAVFQFVARVFLIAEWAISMVYAAEEFPAERRGLVIGVISAFSSLGAIVCAGLVPILLSLYPGARAVVREGNELVLGYAGYEWRSVYFVGVIPLILLAFARRNLKETSRFAEQVGEAHTKRKLTYILGTGYRKRVLQLALIWGLTYLCTNTVVTFWKDFAMTERGLDEAEVARSITVAALVSMPMVFAVGPLLDRLGRRRGAFVVFTLTVLGAFGSYALHGAWLLTLPLTLGIFGAAAVLPVLNAFSTELFPTDLRADAFAIANNLLGRIGYVLAPIGVGAAAEATDWSTAVQATVVFPVIALWLIMRWMPETVNRELEDTSALD
jgi:putative MFS transporter